MLFTMIVNLYVSREILRLLGESDFGLYDVVGGIVAMFTILSGSLSTAISRFMSFELGRGGGEKLKGIFSSSVLIQLILSIVIVILTETGGVWYLNNKLVVDDGREFAAFCVLQCSLVTFILGLLSVPYNASIVAHERMSAFAFISILECLLKLGMVFLVDHIDADKLIVYSVCLLVISLIIRLIYGGYCRKHFEECHLSLSSIEKATCKEMITFSGWNFIGASSAVLKTQGINICINLFFGTLMNAAKSIGMSVTQAVELFSSNFMTALRPAIIKKYSAGEYSDLMRLVFSGTRLSYYLMLMLALPAFVAADSLLAAWLEKVPEHAVLFVRLGILLALSDLMSQTMVILMLATGKIRDYQLVVGGLQLLNLPAAYIALRMGCPAESTVVCSIVISHICLYARLVMLPRMLSFDSIAFVFHVYFRLLAVTLLSVILPTCVYYFIGAGFGEMIIVGIVSEVSLGAFLFTIGLDKEEKTLVAKKSGEVIRKFIKKRKS